MGRRPKLEKGSVKTLSVLGKHLRNSLIVGGFERKRCFGRPSKACYTADCLAFDKDGVCVLCKAFRKFADDLKKTEAEEIEY